MSPFELFLVLGRRWLVLLPLVAATVVMSWHFTETAPVFWARYDIELVPPSRQGNVYAPQADPTDLVRIAQVLEERLNRGDREPRAASQSTPILRLEYADGSLVAAKNRGTQWSDDFVGALAVQVVGTNPGEVTARAQEVHHAVRVTLEGLQDELAVRPDMRVVAYTPDYVEVSAVTAQRPRALAAALLLGGALSVVLTLVADGWLRQRDEGRRHQRVEARESAALHAAT